MVTSLNQGVSARDAGYQMVQYIAARIQATSTGTVTKKIGTVPQGAVITQIHSKVVTAIAPGTLTIGQLGDAGLDNLVSAVAETVGSEVLQPLTTITQPLTADTELWASIVGTATTGDAYVTINFIKPVS